MLDWISHQLRVWRYGAGLLVVLAVWTVVALTIGALALLPVMWIFGLEFSGLAWAIATAAVAPFILPDVATSLADIVRQESPPSALDLWRKQLGLPVRKRP